MPKRWAIPDIHGCAKTLEAAVEYIIQPSDEDELYFLGDYIDRGPDSKGVMDYIMSLESEGLTVHCLKGNHEDVMLRAHEASKHHRKGFLTWQPAAVREWKSKGGKGAMQNFGITQPKDLPEKYLRWISKLDYYYELDDYLLVHAGFNFAIDNPFSDRHAMLWIRDYEVNKEKVNRKMIIHGHVPTPLDEIKANVSNPTGGHIDLDNGIYQPHKSGKGNLCLLELNSGELFVQVNRDF